MSATKSTSSKMMKVIKEDTQQRIEKECRSLLVRQQNYGFQYSTQGYAED